MSTIVSGSPAAPLTLEAVHLLTAQTATYQTETDPEAVLRSGLVEEVAEYLRTVTSEPEVEKDALEEEIGDVLWYASEISSFTGSGVAGLESDQTLDDYQNTNNRSILRLVSQDGVTLTEEEHPLVVLALVALRVVDVMNPKNDDLWLSIKDRPPLSEALGDLLTVIGRVASQSNISLSAAILRVVAKKLPGRERLPHVIEKARDGLVSSERSRLNVHPFVGQLLVKTALAEGLGGTE